MPKGDSVAQPSVYVPRLSSEWDLDSPGTLWRQIDATCCFVDISGFTALSERLARRGRIGAEELTEVLNHVFSRMLGIAYAKGGALLKFGGDALLLAFTRGDHPVLAAQAAVAMRAALREARTLPTSVGRVNLKMSVGVHSGDFHLFRVGTSHRELLITGPGASSTTRMEQIAEAGEIVVSDQTAQRLPSRAVGDQKGAGWLLKWKKVTEDGPGPIPPQELPAGAVQAVIPVALWPRLSEQVGESEHRLASVGFVKFQGVDDLLASKGPDATADALHRIVSAVQQAADAEAVTFLASDIDANGGKIILVTGVPVAQEDDEGRLLRAARAIVAEPLPLAVRIGANHGHVFAGDVGTDFRRTFTIMGDTVNVAARLMAAASPGDLYATGGILEVSRTLFETETLEPFMVKGKARPVQAYRVGAPVGPKSAQAGTLPFRGRNDEHSLLVDLFKAASEGRGRVATIEAERGAGKSRLIAEMVASTTAQTVLFLQGEPNGSSFPYLPLKAPLRHLLGLTNHDPANSGRLLTHWANAKNPGIAPLLPLLAPVLDAAVPSTPESKAVAREFLRDRVADLVLAALDTACMTPLLLIAEDTHWFDETTAEICARLARAAREREWLLCATRRPGATGFIPNEPDLSLKLPPLDEESARVLVDSATDAAPLRPHERDRVVSRAGGNPLFLEELLRIVRDTDIEALPDSLDAVAMREIDSLPSASRQVLLLASVLGHSFERDLLRQLSEPEPSGSSDPFLGLEAQLVAEGPNRLRFRHALLQEAAYQTLPFRTRLAMHREVAETVERGSATPLEVAPFLSLHFLAGQDWERAWKYARLAAEVAMADHASAEAAVYLEKAADAARHLPGIADNHELAEVLAGLGATLELLGEYGPADDAYRRSILTGCLDPPHLAQLIDRRAYIRGEHQGRLPAAIRQLRAAAAQIAGSDILPEQATWIRATLSAREGDLRKRQGRFAEAIRCSRQGVELADKSENTRALALSLSTLDQCLLLTGRYAEAIHFPSAIRLYESIGDHVRAAVTLNNFAVAAFYNSEWDTAATRLQQAINESTKAGDIANAAFGQFNLGDLRLNQGWWDEAFALLSSARRTLEACDDRFLAAMASLSLGRVSVFLGETDLGLGLIESAATTLEGIGTSMECLESRARLTEALIFIGDTERARDALRHTRALEKLSEDRTLSSLVDRLEISLHMAAGEIEVATAKYSSFLEKAREAGSDYEVLMLITLDRHLRGGRPDDGSVQLLERLGVQRLPIPVWL